MTTTTYHSGARSRQSENDTVFLKQADENPRRSPYFHGSLFRFVVLVAGRPVGTIEAKVAAPSGSMPSEATIEYNFFPDARGRGYAQKAITLINEFLRERDINRAVMRVARQKRDPFKAPERAGFAELDTVDSPNGPMLLFARQL